MNYPKISIVTPSFNQGNFIEQTILSILDQEYPNLEYIIIDGGSSDETLDIIKKYENRLTYWVSEKDKGQSDAINKGLAHCTGDIFNWVNSDDFLEPNSLHFIAQEYLQKKYTALCGRVNVLDESVLSHVRKPSYLALTAAETIADFNINQEGTWWSLDAVKQLRGVNTDFKYIMDLDLWIRALLLYDTSSFRSTGQILSNFRRHADAKSTQNAHLSDTENGFIIEQLELFTALLPNSSSFKSYFSLFGLEESGTSVLTYSATEAFKAQITAHYLFSHLKSAFYDNNHRKTKLLLQAIKGNLLPVFEKDIRYIKRRFLFRKFLLTDIFQIKAKMTIDSSTKNCSRAFQKPFTFIKRKVYNLLLRISYHFGARFPVFKRSLVVKKTSFIVHPTRIQLSDPKNSIELGEKWCPPRWYKEHTTNCVEIYAISNASISSDGVLFNQFETFKKSIVYPDFYPRFSGKYTFDQLVSFPSRKYNERVFLIWDHWGKSNYFHWMIDSLSRLEICLKSNDNITLVLFEHMPRFIFDTLQAYPNVKLLVVPSNTIPKFSEVLLPNYPISSGLCAPEYIQGVRSKLLEHLCNLSFLSALPLSEIVYVSRTKQKTRRILNEEELLKQLDPLKLTVLNFEDYTFWEQVYMMSKAKVLISAHGSNLVNMLFMQENSTIIEINQEDTSSATLCYWSLSNALLLDYYYIAVENKEGNYYLGKRQIQIIANLFENI